MIADNDNDGGGLRYARRVAEALTTRTRSVPIKLAAEGKDVSDHLDAGRTMDELVSVSALSDIFVPADEVPEEDLEWLWPGFIPDRHVTVLEGDGGIGKSTLLIDLIARTTARRRMPDGGTSIRSGAVVYITNEDDPSTVIVLKLRRAGADLSRVLLLNPQRMRELSFPDDVTALRQWCEHKGVVLIVIDPWSSFLSIKLSNNSDQEFRHAIGPAQRLAQQLGVAVVLVRHLKKGGGPVREQGLGSIAIANTARSVLLAKTDPDDEAGAVLLQHKRNLNRAGRPLRYRLESDDPNNPATLRIEWRGASGHSITDLTADEADEDRTASGECADWLADYLAANQCRDTRKRIMSAARNDGFSWSPKVWRLACKRLSVNTTERQKTEHAGTVWTLPIDRMPLVPQPKPEHSRPSLYMSEGTSGAAVTEGPDSLTSTSDNQALAPSGIHKGTSVALDGLNTGPTEPTGLSNSDFTQSDQSTPRCTESHQISRLTVGRLAIRSSPTT